MIAPVMADLPEERLDASTAFTNVGVDYFGNHCEDWAKKRKAIVLSLYMSNYESGAYRSGT